MLTYSQGFNKRTQSNTTFGGLGGALAVLEDAALSHFFDFTLHVFGAMGAGDVKLFSAIGAVTGVHLVMPTFFFGAFDRWFACHGLRHSGRRR